MANMTNAKDYGFYTIDPDYLKYLHKIDSEVYYNPSYYHNIKPFIGIVVGLKDCSYFIPLTSTKEKHKTWKNVSSEHFLIYEVVNSSDIIQGDIYKRCSDTQNFHILSVLDIKKMIPVPKGAYSKIEFNRIKDKKYLYLLKREFNFCLKIKEKILHKTESLYQKQKESGRRQKTHCDFSKCETAMKAYEKIMEKRIEQKGKLKKHQKSIR